MSSLSNQQIAECRRLFELFDQDHDGTISVEEIYDVLESCGKSLTIGEIKYMMKEVDLDGNGTLDFEEFKIMMAKQLNTFESYHDIFMAFDQDQDGYVSADDLQKTMRSVGEDMTDDEALKMIRRVGTKKEGLVDYEEFLVVLEKGGLVDAEDIDLSIGETSGSLEANKPLETVTVDSSSIS